MITLITCTRDPRDLAGPPPPPPSLLSSVRKGQREREREKEKRERERESDANIAMVPKVPKRVRYHGPYSMCLDRPGEFGVTLLKNMAYWEVPRLAVGLFMRWRYGGSNKKKGGGGDKGEAQREFVECAPSYVMSLVHAVVISGLGLKIMSMLWDAPTPDKFYISENTASRSAAGVDLIERSNWLFFGYMVDDLVNVLAYYPKLGKMDMVAHHFVFIACAILAGGTQSFLFPFSWLLAGELSTPLLTVRWFIRQLAAMESPALVTAIKLLGIGGGSTTTTTAAATAALELAVSKTFMAVFFVVRVIVYGGGLGHTLKHLARGDLGEIPFVPRALVLGILLAGAGLNAHWFRIMLFKALGLKRPGGKAAAAGKQKKVN